MLIGTQGASAVDQLRLMLGNACDEGDAERTAAAEEVRAMLATAIGQVFPGPDVDAQAEGSWAFAHGMAYLHLGGKLSADSRDEIATRVRGALAAILAVDAPA